VNGYGGNHGNCKVKPGDALPCPLFWRHQENTRVLLGRRFRSE